MKFSLVLAVVVCALLAQARKYPNAHSIDKLSSYQMHPLSIQVGENQDSALLMIIDLRSKVLEIILLLDRSFKISFF